MTRKYIIMIQKINMYFYYETPRQKCNTYLSTYVRTVSRYYTGILLFCCEAISSEQGLWARCLGRMCTLSLYWQPLNSQSPDRNRPHQIPPSVSLPMSGWNKPTAQAHKCTQNDTVTWTNTQMSGKEQSETKDKCTDRYKKTKTVVSGTDIRLYWYITKQ